MHALGLLQLSRFVCVSVHRQICTGDSGNGAFDLGLRQSVLELQACVGPSRARARYGAVRLCVA